MNDDQFSELELLAASAYLDGEATPDEREIVESSPALLAMVTDWRSLRDEVHQVTALPERREAAIAAALSVFDELHADPRQATPAASNTPATPANVVRFERRRRQYRLVGGAAAALVFVFGGLALLQAGQDDTDLDGVASVESAAKQQATTPEAPAPAVAMEAPASGDEATTGMAPAATEAPTEREEPAATEAPAETAAPADAALPVDTEVVEDAGEVETTSTTELPVVDSSEELSEYYATTRVALPAPVEVMPATDPEACPIGSDQVIGEVTYQGITALVVLSADGSTLRAIDTSTCAVLLTTTP